MIPIVGRGDILGALLERLSRPDDVRNSPKDFPAGGFFGLAGSGKTRLLSEAAERAAALTPYVVRIDFDSRENAAPRTPSEFVRRLIESLESIERGVRPFWQRWMWRWTNPLTKCAKFIDTPVTVVNQSLTVISGQATDITQSVHAGTLPSGFGQVFGEALAALRSRSHTQQLFGALGLPKERPLILVTVDTVDMAVPAIRAWLPDLLHITGARNTLEFHLQFVLAGRFQHDGVLDTLLPALSPDDTRELIRSYASERLKALDTTKRAGLMLVLESKELQDVIAMQSDGIPLLVQLLIDAEARAPDAAANRHDPGPIEHETRARFVIEQYLQRLSRQAYQRNDVSLWEQYYLMMYAVVPRVVTNAALLRALLCDLPGTNFRDHTNYHELLERLRHEAFATQTPGGSVVIHSLVRESILGYLESNDRETVIELHRRAAVWFAKNNDQPNYFHHAVRTRDNASFDEWVSAVRTLLGSGQATDAQTLIDLARGAPLGVSQVAVFTILDADLAWTQGHRDRAVQRLRAVYRMDAAKAVWTDAADRLERWLDFDRRFEQILENGTFLDVDRSVMPDLLWWAEQRGCHRTTAFAATQIANEAVAAGNFGLAETWFGRALQASEAVQDAVGIARALQSLAEIALRLGPLDRAMELLTRSLASFAEDAQSPHRARALAMLGVSTFHHGDQSVARTLVEQSLQLYERLEDTAGQANGLRLLALMDWVGDPQEPSRQGKPVHHMILDRLRRADRLSAAASDTESRVKTLLLLGEIALDDALSDQSNTGFFATAESHYREAALLAKTVNDPQAEALAHVFLGVLSAKKSQSTGNAARVDQDDVALGIRPTSRLDHWDAAIQHFWIADRLYTKTADLADRAHTLVVLGVHSYFVRDSHGGESAGSLLRALEIYERFGDTIGAAGVFYVQAQIALWQGDGDTARTCIELADDRCRQSSQRSIVTSFVRQLAERIASGLGPPVGTFHLQYLLRTRGIDLFGWSDLLRRETSYIGAVLRIHPQEQLS